MRQGAWIAASIVLLSGCASDIAEDGPSRPYTGPLVGEGTPLSMQDAWQIAADVAADWGGRLYTLSGTEQNPAVDAARESVDPALGDGVLPFWYATIRDPVALDVLHIKVYAEGVAAWDRSAVGYAYPGQERNDTPPPGAEWLERVNDLPAWGGFADAYGVEWTWDTFAGIKVHEITSSSDDHGRTYRFDHAGWSVVPTTDGGMAPESWRGRALAGESLAVDGLYTVMALLAEHPGAQASGLGADALVEVQAPNGTTWKLGNGDSLVLTAPAPGTWHVSSATGQGDVLACTPGTSNGPHAADVACAYLP